MLTEGLGWGLLQCRSAGGEIRRRVGAELGGGAGTGVLRALDLPEGSVRVLRRWSRAK